ncbi:tripartite tricarboxylate transporter TctB family protein [Rossellomorea sp. KS-H15a]|uniref:tripartite tricarboxylate transporter TctB family protein n=1 Tax=Rossellomorea sp. KS-H15a TaxID=2963940 RepID=UPI0020C64BF5|nr:tripartite tricarboxylate transporter TctB family protein [Rossellomorea sp. KS-H15a]UTE77455.1 tripartite tricarboxylate transporter TctB family protein [Rossellomorea sp. KS-H15a]
MSVIIIGISAYFYSMSQAFPQNQMQETGPDFMPKIYCGFLILLSLILIVKEVMSKAKEEKKEAAMLYAVAAMAMVAVYLILIPYVGFYLSTAAVIVSFLLFTKVKSLYTLAAVPLGTIAFIYIFFEKFLSVSLPLGTLFT